MKKYEFREYELSEKAFEQYSGSDMRFWKDDNGVFYVGESKGTAEEIGSVKDVEEFLESFAEEE